MLVQTEPIFFLRQRLHTLRKEKSTNRKRKKFFFFYDFFNEINFEQYGISLIYCTSKFTSKVTMFFWAEAAVMSAVR